MKFSSIKQRLIVIAMAASLAAIAGDGFAADAGPSGAPIVIAMGKSRLVELPSAYSDVMIADPKIADILPLNNHSVYVVGKAMGSTALTVYGAGRRVLYSSDVLVSADLENFKARLHEVLPRETNVAVSTANQHILLSGTVSSPSALHQIMTLADTYDPGKVVNMMGVQGTQQVMLSVRFVEMERTTAKDLRINVQQDRTNTNPAVTVLTGDTLLNRVQTAASQNSFGIASLAWSVGGGDLTFLFDALESKGLIKTLAEPNLVAMSGDTANFLAGGEYPIPVPGAFGQISVDYKRYGVGLAFTPTVLAGGQINIKIEPEVSEIDTTRSVAVGQNVTVPALTVRRASTTIELRDGQSFMIGGLLQSTSHNDIEQLPWLGEVPVLGALFRSASYQKRETDLAIIVTPRLARPMRPGDPIKTPLDNAVASNDTDLFVNGKVEVPKSQLNPGIPERPFVGHILSLPKGVTNVSMQ